MVLKEIDNLKNNYDDDDDDDAADDDDNDDDANDYDDDDDDADDDDDDDDTAADDTDTDDDYTACEDKQPLKIWKTYWCVETSENDVILTFPRRGAIQISLNKRTSEDDKNNYHWFKMSTSVHCF